MSELRARQVRTTRPSSPDLSSISFRTDDNGEQREKYLSFYRRSVVATKYADVNCLHTLGLLESVQWMLNNVGLSHFCTRNDPTYEPIVLEFMSSFKNMRLH